MYERNNFSETATEATLTEQFDDMLNETNPPYPIGGVVLFPAAALKRTDPIAYRQAFLDWLDSEGWDEAL